MEEGKKEEMDRWKRREEMRQGRGDVRGDRGWGEERNEYMRRKGRDGRYKR